MVLSCSVFIRLRQLTDKRSDKILLYCPVTVNVMVCYPHRPFKRKCIERLRTVTVRTNRKWMKRPKRKARLFYVFII